MHFGPQTIKIHLASQKLAFEPQQIRCISRPGYVSQPTVCMWRRRFREFGIAGRPHRRTHHRAFLGMLQAVLLPNAVYGGGAEPDLLSQSAGAPVGSSLRSFKRSANSRILSPFALPSTIRALFANP
jgi:hypothetical protein